jgi:Flp pilus assembly protein TadD
MKPAFNPSRSLWARLFLMLFCCPPIVQILVCSNVSAAEQMTDELNAFQKGIAALKDNRMQEALTEFTQAEREHPTDALIRNFRGIVLVRIGQTPEAEAEYREAVRIDPHMADAYRNLGFLKWTEHQLEPAREALQHSLQLVPGDSFAHYYLGRVELDAQNYVAAIQELSASGMQLPADPIFSMQLAAAYITLGRNQEARLSLRQLTNIPLNGAQSIHEASLFLQLHDNNSAIAAIQQWNAIAAPGENSCRQFDLALVHLLSGNYEKAIEGAYQYNNSPSQQDLNSPQSAEAWTIIGIAASHLKQTDRALNSFRHATDAVPGNEEYWLNLTRELMDLSRYSEAIASVQQGITANPKSYALHLRLGAAQLAAGQYAEAETVFSDLVNAGDPLPTSYVGLAQVLLRTGRPEEAASELAAAEQKLGPTFLLSYFRGLALDRAGKPVEALRAFQQAAKLNPSSSEVHLSLGKMQLGFGHLNDAIAELQESLRLDPKNDQAKRLLSKAYARTGDTKRAAALAVPSTSSTSSTEPDLLGDFFVPQWQMPPESARPQ